MTYTASASFSPRGTRLQYTTNLSLAYTDFAEVTQIDFSGQKLDLADVTNFSGGIFKEWLATLLDSGEVSFKCNFVPSDASQAAMLGFFNAATRVYFQIILPINPSTGVTYGHFTFLAFVSEWQTALPISKQAEVTGKLKVTGAITFVAGS